MIGGCLSTSTVVQMPPRFSKTRDRKASRSKIVAMLFGVFYLNKMRHIWEACCLADVWSMEVVFRGGGGGGVVRDGKGVAN